MNITAVAFFEFMSHLYLEKLRKISGDLSAIRDLLLGSPEHELGVKGRIWKIYVCLLHLKTCLNSRKFKN
jgi:hypothetical protein